MNMTQADVTRLIEDEIGDDWSRSNLHGVVLKECLVSPVKGFYDDPAGNGPALEMWLVLVENLPGGGGYRIVFDEEEQIFGLAVPGKVNDAFIGYYGTFWETLEGM